MEIIIGNKKVLIDEEDFNKISKINWSIDGKGYAYKHKNKSGDRMSLHRFLLNPPRHLVVDHINHDILDNRKSNLRIVTQAVNTSSINKKGYSANTSGIIGVSKHPISGWRARIRHLNTSKGKWFTEKEDAINQRKKWELELLTTGNIL